jgi:hypothetical protein
MSMAIEGGDFPPHPQAQRRYESACMPVVWFTQCSFNARRQP